MVPGEATTWEYSPEGDVLKITDPTGVFTAFEYDEHHDIVAMLNPAGEASASRAMLPVKSQASRTRWGLLPRLNTMPLVF